jgi:hypothetical protein
MDYFKIVKESFDIWWKNKYLWILGIIAAVFSGGSSTSSNFSQNSIDSKTLGLDNFEMSPAVIVVIIVVALVGLAFMLLGIYLKSRADASIISSIPLIEKNTELGFKKSWSLSSSKWIKLFLLNLFISIPVLVVVLITVVIAMIFLITSKSAVPSAFVLTLACAGIPLICLLVIYSVISRIIYTFASRISVLNNGTVWDSIKKGWDFITKNLSDIVIFWLINLAIGAVTGTILAVIGLVIFAPMILIVLPILVLNLWVGIIVGVLLSIVSVVLLSLLSGPIYSFGEIYWTKVYLTLKKENA